MKQIVSLLWVRMKTNIRQWRTKAWQELLTISPEAGIEINAILKFVLQKESAWLLANDDFELADEEINLLDQLLARLRTKEPLAYLTGTQEFYGLPFRVNRSVLIPRPETELLVEEAIKWGRKFDRPINILDVGTGSGAILISVLRNLPDGLGVAVDISLAALKVATENTRTLDCKNVSFVNADLCHAIKAKFDLVCANLPYIPTNDLAEMPPAHFEPLKSLDGGKDGLRLIAALLNQLTGKLNFPGLLLFEIQYDQGERVVAMANDCFPGSRISIIKDLAGLNRIVRIELHVSASAS